MLWGWVVGWGSVSWVLVGGFWYVVGLGFIGLRYFFGLDLFVIFCLVWLWSFTPCGIVSCCFSVIVMESVIVIFIVIIVFNVVFNVIVAVIVIVNVIIML